MWKVGLPDVRRRRCPVARPSQARLARLLMQQAKRAARCFSTTGCGHQSGKRLRPTTAKATSMRARERFKLSNVEDKAGQDHERAREQEHEHRDRGGTWSAVLLQTACVTFITLPCIMSRCARAEGKMKRRQLRRGQDQEGTRGTAPLCIHYMVDQSGRRAES